MKFFNTDGLRGNALEIILSNDVFQIGQFLAQNSKRIVIGFDTRETSPLIVDLLINGIVSHGVDVLVLGIVPTPYLSYFLRKNKYDYGIMVTASHNPYFDNGIKIFTSEGNKLDENEIERLKSFLKPNSYIELANKLGRVDYQKSIKDYINERTSLSIYPNKKKIILDLANGSYSFLNNNLNIDNVKIINASPNGKNINYGCGSLYPEKLQKIVIEENYDYGVSFDGDGDRMIVVDKKNIYDGDDLLLAFCRYYHLNKVVMTKASNLGIREKLKKEEIEIKIVDIGDKNVIDEMRKNNIEIGGEPSGHIIFSSLMYSDSLYSFIKLLDMINQNKLQKVKRYYTYCKNISHQEKLYRNIDEIKKIILEIIDENDEVLIRESGTEDVLRIIVQTQKKYLIKTIEHYFNKMEKKLCVE